MSEGIRIRVRSGQSEVEIETAVAHIREAIELIPEVVGSLPEAAHEQARPRPAVDAPRISTAREPAPAQPAISVEKGDSLSDIISKFFADPWGKSPRRLSEVREALQSYGLNYPKQSVAVALLRLAKSSKIRRFKGDGGEYVYTASTVTVPAQVLVLPDTDPGQDAELESPANL